jgi:glycosidase
VLRSVSAAFAAAAALVGGGSAVAPPSGAQLAALSQPPVYSSLASQRIYFVMPDRYANGDPSNDTGGLTGSRDVTGYDPTDPGWYHGGDLKGLTGGCADPHAGLQRIKDLGFTALWVTPVLKQKTVQPGSAAYHGYWGLDFTTVDPHLGTDQDFADLVACAHRLGMKVYLDVVVNHTADVVRVPSQYVSPAVAPYRNCHGKRFDPARFVTRRFPCLAARFMPHVPTVPSAERNAKKPAWLNSPLRYHDRGDIDFSSCNQVCFEQGDFFGLDDLFTEQPVVMNGLAQIYSSWITRFHVDGFRVDTAKHVNAAFFRLWVPKILAAARSIGTPDFPIFGEVTLNDAADLSRFVRDRGLPSVLDFPFQDAAAGFAAGTSTAEAVTNRLADDDYFRTASGVAPTPPTFLGNHDMGRAAEQIQSRSNASGDTLLAQVLLGYDLLYLLRGAPVVYYGDEVGMIGRGGDQQARQDMFPTQVAEWRTQPRIGSSPIGSGSSFDVTANPIEVRLRALGALRDSVPALSTGSTIVRAVSARAFVVSRIDRSEPREYVAAFNSGTAPATLSFRTSTPLSAWTPLLGTTENPTSGTTGELSVTVPPVSAVLLRAERDLPSSPASAPTLTVAPDDLSSYLRLSVAGAHPTLTVAFAVRRGTGAWQRVASDDSPPYRGFLDPARFKRTEKVQVVAIARAVDGSVAVSKVMTVVPRPS